MGRCDTFYIVYLVEWFTTFAVPEGILVLLQELERDIIGLFAGNPGPGCCLRNFALETTLQPGVMIDIVAAGAADAVLGLTTYFTNHGVLGNLVEQFICAGVGVWPQSFSPLG